MFFGFFAANSLVALRLRGPEFVEAAARVALSYSVRSSSLRRLPGVLQEEFANRREVSMIWAGFLDSRAPY